MAVAQTSYSASVPYPNPASPQRRRVGVAAPQAVPGKSVRRRPRAGARVSFIPFVQPYVRPTIAAAGLAAALIVYVYGYAQMTTAGYQRVRLQAEERNMRVEQNRLQTLKNGLGRKDNIVAWAESHGFVKPVTPPLTIASIPHNIVREGR